MSIVEPSGTTGTQNTPCFALVLVCMQGHVLRKGLKLLRTCLSKQSAVALHSKDRIRNVNEKPGNIQVW